MNKIQRQPTVVIWGLTPVSLRCQNPFLPVAENFQDEKQYLAAHWDDNCCFQQNAHRVGVWLTSLAWELAQGAGCSSAAEDLQYRGVTNHTWELGNLHQLATEAQKPQLDSVYCQPLTNTADERKCHLSVEARPYNKITAGQCFLEWSNIHVK